MSQHLGRKHRPPGGKGTSSPKQPCGAHHGGIKGLEFQCSFTPSEPPSRPPALRSTGLCLPRCSQAVHTREPGQHHPAHPLWIPGKLSQADFSPLRAGLRSSRVCVSRLLKLLRHSCKTHTQDLGQDQGQRLPSGCGARNQTQGQTRAKLSE